MSNSETSKPIKRDWFAEAIKIAVGDESIALKRKHLVAVIQRLEIMSGVVIQLKEHIERTNRNQQIVIQDKRIISPLEASASQHKP